MVIAVANETNGCAITQWDVDHRLDIITACAARRGTHAKVNAGFELVLVRLVGNEAHVARLRARSKECALRAGKHLDTLEVSCIYVEVTSAKRYGHLVEVQCYTGSRALCWCNRDRRLLRGRTADVNFFLTRTDTGAYNVRQELDVVIEGHNVLRPHGIARQGVD